MANKLVSVDANYNLPAPVQNKLGATFAPKWKANTAYVAGQNVTAPDGNVVRAKVNFTSASTYVSTDWEYGTIPGGSNVPVIKSSTDTRAGIWEYTHNASTGYLYHLLAGTGFAAPAAILAIGNDNGTGTSILLPNKAGGRAIVIDQKATVTSPTAYGFLATQSSSDAPLVRLEQNVNGAAPALQVISGPAGTDQIAIQVSNADGTVGIVYADTGKLLWKRNIEMRNKDAGTPSVIAAREHDGVANPSPVRFAQSGVEFRTYAGSGTSYWPKRITHTGPSLKIQGAGTTAGIDAAPAWVDGLVMEFLSGIPKVGFYGATPVARAAAITAPAGGATVDAEARAALTSVLTALKNMGITL